MRNQFENEESFSAINFAQILAFEYVEFCSLKMMCIYQQTNLMDQSKQASAGSGQRCRSVARCEVYTMCFIILKIISATDCIMLLN